ncbi:mannose/glucose-specific lectin-like [Rutidosis leptorrhynchoides]|uniref:mannose/glucose-specific lectin-like n=1 Tax=Rutidosis leptorrhynchoides TaxID=125765 RepID=UPI003A993832
MDHVDWVKMKEESKPFHIYGLGRGITVGVSTGEYAGYTIISSLCFITNKTTHEPFGQTTGTPFAVPWKQGSFAGFYGRAGYYIDAIVVYLKASQETARVGLWGTEDTESFMSSQYRWSFCLEKNYTLSKITIRHSDMINCLMFTSEHVMGLVVQSNKVGGHYDESTISEVNLGWDEEIIGVNGTFESIYGVSTIISSLSFITNERSFGPFGSETGTHFSVSWNKGSFAGFYGITTTSSVDAIGVYLRPTPTA